MFTGLVEGLGKIAYVRRRGAGLELAVFVHAIKGDLRIGDSVSLSGCCSTVTAIQAGRAMFQLTKETLARTWFGSAQAGQVVNLERSLLPSTRMGGHFVQGHVDGLGRVCAMDHRKDGSDLEIQVPAELMRYCVEKGSIAIDGVSLTIAKLSEERITIALIPHTMELTSLGGLRSGQELHLEIDILAKYVERLLKVAR